MFRGRKLLQFLANRESIMKFFPLLCTVHDGFGLMHCESFLVNSALCTTSKVFLRETFTVYSVA